MAMERLLTVKQTAEFLNVPDKTVYLWVSQRKIPHYKIGKCVRFDPSEIKDWLRDRRVEASASSKAKGTTNRPIRRPQPTWQSFQTPAKKIVGN